MIFYETSAKSGENVEDGFIALATEARKRQHEQFKQNEEVAKKSNFDLDSQNIE